MHVRVASESTASRRARPARPRARWNEPPETRHHSMANETSGRPAASSRSRGGRVGLIPERARSPERCACRRSCRPHPQAAGRVPACSSAIRRERSPSRRPQHVDELDRHAPREAPSPSVLQELRTKQVDIIPARDDRRKEFCMLAVGVVVRPDPRKPATAFVDSLRDGASRPWAVGKGGGGAFFARVRVDDEANTGRIRFGGRSSGACARSTQADRRARARTARSRQSRPAALVRSMIVRASHRRRPESREQNQSWRRGVRTGSSDTTQHELVHSDG